MWRTRKEGGWDCKFCKENFITRILLEIHIKEKHPGPHWGNAVTKARKLGLPDPKMSEETRKKIGLGIKKAFSNGLPEEMKKKISDSMKKAHAEGRAYCYAGRSKRSYPETWMQKVILNEFDDKDCIEQLHITKYWLDFAWPKKKKYIEIDGSQHERFDFPEKDRIRDSFLENLGWEVLRIKWKECFKESKKFIKIMNEFIGK